MNRLSKESVARVQVDENAAGQRIDNFLARMMKGVPKSHVYRILRSGEVRLNGKRVGPDARLAVGDTVRVPPVRTASAPATLSGSAARVRVRSLAIVHEDDDFLAVDKPPGLAVHGGSGISAGLIESLRAARPEARFLELVHRLDRDTSGLLLVAKRRPALTALHAMFRDGAIDKRYRLLVRGRWRDEKRTVKLPLHRYATREGERRVRVDDDLGRAAATTFRRLQAWPLRDPPLALLEAELLTGRTHQIRVHLAHLGFPLAGDEKYGDFAWNRELAKRGLKRMFLHAAVLAFAHPTAGTPVVLEAALPPDLAGFLNTLASESADAK
ncbi:MAG TPA: RluA family pseudouridine synthase [Casimicrobiaceae bacterium]|nr:RluA family pseudouridine synthase [Casimicrobiaceae bacterium]